MIRSLLLGVRVVSNEELSKTVDTSDAWIFDRTGIRQRHLANETETAAFMGARAAAEALDHAKVSPSEVDVIILGTTTPDQAFPSTAARVQAELGVRQGFAFDIAAACTGFVYGLSIADALIRSGQARTAIVIGSEVYSRILNWEDRGTCVLFGDGAGAVVLQAGEGAGTGADRGLLSTHLHTDGTLGDILYVDGAVGRREKSGHLVMNGREVFRHAVAKLAGAVDEALEKNGLTQDAVDWLVPHQANRRIIDAMGRKLGLPPERVVVTVDTHANTSAASIPLALRDVWHAGRVLPGQLVLMEGLGGGLTWGSALARI